jgi:Mycotoxin biosynthesis protein UstYa
MAMLDYIKKLQDSGGQADIAMDQVDKPYSALMQHEEGEDSSDSLDISPVPRAAPTQKVSRLIQIAHWALHLLLLGLLAFVLDRNRNLDCRPKSPLFSPADEAIEWEVVKFTSGLHSDKTIYQGDPSPEVDQAWYDLYKGKNSSEPLSLGRLLTRCHY